MNSRGRHIIHSLFELFVVDPYCLPNDIKSKFQSDIREKLLNTEGYEKETVEDYEDIRVVCDYIASLTDKEAVDIFRSTLI
jgi:dGTP triphosphohydrolase